MPGETQKELLKDIRDTQKSIQKDTSNIRVDVGVLKEQTRTNTDNLAKHMGETKLLRTEVEGNKEEALKRIAKIEVPTKIIGYIGVPLGIIAGIIGLLIKLNII